MQDSCSYLPEQASRLEYEIAPDLTTAEYARRLLAGWRRFGNSLFRPQCLACSACQSLRVDVARFRPNRSQKRNRARNALDVQLEIGSPSFTHEKIELSYRFHGYQAGTRGWDEPVESDWISYINSFLDNPIPTEEWRYELDGKLVGVGYVDHLPGVGLSAIYFIHDPAHRARGLGVWNVLRLIEECGIRGLPHLYLGYLVEGCQSLEYKKNFVPSQILSQGSVWVDFRP